jgi:hypothetical protein
MEARRGILGMVDDTVVALHGSSANSSQLYVHNRDPLQRTYFTTLLEGENLSNSPVV